MQRSHDAWPWDFEYEVFLLPFLFRRVMLFDVHVAIVVMVELVDHRIVGRQFQECRVLHGDKSAMAMCVWVLGSGRKVKRQKVNGCLVKGHYAKSKKSIRSTSRKSKRQRVNGEKVKEDEKSFVKMSIRQKVKSKQVKGDTKSSCEKSTRKKSVRKK